MMRGRWQFAGLLVLAGSCLAVSGRADNTALTAKVEPKAVEFFETQVRPLLFNKCYSCHGAKQQSGGIRLDSREFMLKGGGSSAVLTPGEPEKSLLVTVTHYDGNVKMPPTGKLKPEEIAALTEWVKSGAAWPEKEGDKPASADSRLNHWSFQPVKKSPIPKVSNPAWAQNPIDAFIFAKLAAKKLAPSPIGG